MDSETLYQVIQEIDQELSSLEVKTFEQTFKPLINLRNKLLLKYQPCSTINWQIKNKRVLKQIKKANWELHWR